MKNLSSTALQGVALIGIGVRLPGIRTTKEFWQSLLKGQSTISFFSKDEVLASGIELDVVRNPNYIKAGSYLDNIEYFDAEFFNYSVREAQLMDPQQRLFMECCWEVIEQAGYNPETYKMGIGIFAGANISTYAMNLLTDSELQKSVDSLRIRHGIGNDYLTTKVSYKLDLKGPSMTVQSACSTSLVAIHQACQSILNGECTMSLAGGTSLITPQKTGYMYQEGGINSQDGYCRPFDRNASGTVFTSGVGVVLLKDLEHALQDGDRIYAVIRGSAVNNDGSSKIGYTAPSFQGQSQVIAEALAFAGIATEEVGYIEAHGTGTKVGDPLEVAALNHAFDTSKRNYCGIGSLKSNYGHLGTAAGVMGFIKAALAVHYGVIPRTLHFEHPNPAINFETTPFYVVNQTIQWPSHFQDRIAGVSSFGVGGTNAHLILSSAPEESKTGTTVMPNVKTETVEEQLIVLSARTNLALTTMRANLLESLHSSQHSLHDIAHTLQRGRKVFLHRDAWVCKNLDDLRAQLQKALEQPLPPITSDGNSTTFVIIPGTAQLATLVSQLAQRYPLLAKLVNQSMESLQANFHDNILNAAKQGPIWQAVMDHLYQTVLIKFFHHIGASAKHLVIHNSRVLVGLCVSEAIDISEMFDILAHGLSSSLSRQHLTIKVRAPHIPIALLCEHLPSVDAGVVNIDIAAALDSHQVPNELLLQAIQMSPQDTFVVDKYPTDEILGDWKHFLVPLVCQRGTNDTSILQALAAFWKQGACLDWDLLSPEPIYRKVPLPTYPFERQRFWIPLPHEKERLTSSLTSHKTRGVPENNHNAIDLQDKQTQRWDLLCFSDQKAENLDSITRQAVREIAAYKEKKSKYLLSQLTPEQRSATWRQFAVTSSKVAPVIYGDKSFLSGMAHNRDGQRADGVIFLFPGQGSQYYNMGHDLYEHYPVFAATIDKCAEILWEHLNLDIRKCLFGPEQETEKRNKQLRETYLAQPALFTIEYALARLWESFGVVPRAMLGHSLGELTAACLAGVFDIDTALHLIALRGKALHNMAPGRMLSVSLSEGMIHELLPKSLDIAAINGPHQYVVSGKTEEIEAFRQQLEQRGEACRVLHTSHAFHSRAVDKVMPGFLTELQKIAFHPPNIPFLSNVTGTWIGDREATDPQYWLQHMRRPVLFFENMQTALHSGQPFFLEVGPGNVLTTLYRQTHPNRIQLSAPSLPNAKRKHADEETLLSGLGQLWLRGDFIKWSQLINGYPNLSTAEIDSQHDKLPKKEENVDRWFYTPAWEPQALTGQQLEHNYTWLVFTHASSFDNEIIEALRKRADRVVLVRPGDSFSFNVDTGEYRVAPSDLKGYCQLFDRLAEDDLFPQKVLHLWSSLDKDFGPQSNDRLLAMGYYSLLQLAQAIELRSEARNIEIEVLSNELFVVEQTDTIRPAKSALVSPCQNIPRECSNLSMRCIDYGLPPQDCQVRERLISHLVDEIFSKSTTLLAAYRGENRYTRTYHREITTENHSIYRRGGVYLLIGGLGAVGRAIARYLAESWQATLILTGRSQLPEPDEREHWSTSSPQNLAPEEKLLMLQELVSLGATAVIYQQADITKRNQVVELVQNIEQRFGNLDGVFHCAGNTQTISCPFQETTPGFSEIHIRPKLDGVENLYYALQERPLSFVTLISSNASLLGGMGFTAYSAGNWLLDAFAAHYYQEEGTKWTATNWDGWSRDAQLQTMARDYRMTVTESHRALEVLGKCRRCPQIAIATADLQKREQLWMRRRSLDLYQRHKAVAVPIQDITATVAELWKEVLGVAEVDRDRDFFDCGGDSLLAVYLISKLSEQFTIKLSVETLMEASTIATIADLLYDKLQGNPLVAVKEFPEVLVQISTGDRRRKPLLMIHPAGGGVYFYRDLARALGPEQPIFGLQSKGQEDGHFLTTVEEMATEYIKAIRLVQPQGPYQIGGASFGGVVAFEIAQQLRNQGEEIELLALIDTPGSGQRSRRLTTEDEILKYIIDSDYEDAGISVIELAQRSWDEKLEYCKERVIKARAKADIVAEENSRLVLSYSVEQARRFVLLFENNVTAHWKYQPKPYPGRLVFFRAQNRREGHDPLYPERPWTEVATRGVDLYVTPGDHITMNYMPNVNEIGLILKKYLK